MKGDNMTDKQKTYIREYYREYRQTHRAKINNRQKMANRMKSNPDKARRIEEAKAYYRAEFPPIDGIVMNDSRNRFDIYYNRGEKRCVTECYFEVSEDCKIHYTAICDLMKEEDEHGTDYGS
jgi:hypothetical protein